MYDIVVGYIFCGAGVCQIFIDSDGSARPCGFLSFSGGNLRRSPLWDIWCSEKWEFFERRKPIREKSCLTCRFRKYCISGCTARFLSRRKNCILTQRDQPGMISQHGRLCLMAKPR